MQYPDTILVTRDSEFTQGETGDFEAGTDGTTFTSECRAEPAESNPVIRGTDGSIIVPTWIVYMPKTTEVFEFGDNVTLTKADGSVYEGDVKRQYNGQFNSRLWV